MRARWAIVALLALCAAAPLRAHENVVVHRGLAHWSVDILANPFYTNAYRTEIGNGTEQEDVPATRSLGHFYNPETDSAPWFALGSGPATTNSQDQYNEAVSAYLGNNLIGTDAAFHRLGRAIHFIQDMTSPAHTHDDDHATGDDFEGWGPDNYPAMDFSTVTPKFATPPTAAGFVSELANFIYDKTVYQTVIHESEDPQPNSLLKQMFPTLHFETGGFFFDDHFEIDRIGDWGCDLGCADDWWIPDELLSTDNGGPGGVARHSGSAYVENTGGDGGPVIPVVFDGQTNSANETLLQLYARKFYPEAIAYGAGLLQVFASQVGPTPTVTATRTGTATATATATSSATATPTAPSTATSTATATPTASATPTAVATATSTSTRTATPTSSATGTATRTATVTATPTASATGSASATRTDTPTVTPTPTTTPLCVATPRSGCGTPAVPGKSLVQLRDSSTDKFLWRWSAGDASLGQFGRPEQDAAYALCIYDGNALAMDLQIPPGDFCGGYPCWKPGTRGFKYKGRGSNADGVDTVLLKEGSGGRAKLLVKAKGAALALPTPFDPNSVQFAQSPSVRVQLVNTEGACWEAVYSAPALRNIPGTFKDKSD